ncbi:MAG: cation-transporting P-type ATPase [Pirellulales bacterium]
MTHLHENFNAAQWATRPAEDVLRLLGSSYAGLTQFEAHVRLEHNGRNTLPRPVQTPWWLELAKNFVHWMAILLWIGAALAWLAGMPELALAIVFIVLINGAFGYWQQYSAGRAIESLEALLPRQASVRRDAEEVQVPAEEVVAGDLLILREGESICADARLLTASRLRVDMSSLTGESRLIPRTADCPSVDHRSTPQLSNLLLAGTLVASGTGEAVVFATAGQTEFGRLASMTQQKPVRPSPLQQEIMRITRLITVLSVSMGVAFFALGISLGGLRLIDSFLFGVGVIVANVPEGLLPTITLALAIAARRLAARSALVRRLEKVETLGCTTVIITDKTGTLTENEMTVRELWAAGGAWRLGGTGYSPVGDLEPVCSTDSRDSVLDALKVAALCCDARLIPPASGETRWRVVGDPTEAALLVAAAKVGLTSEVLASTPRLSELPFDSLRKRMTTIQRSRDRALACVKGAPSHVLPLCSGVQWGSELRPLDQAILCEISQVHDAMADRGLRVLAVAQREVGSPSMSDDGWRVDDVERELTFLGLLAMEDPPRVGVGDAVNACRSAGIRVIMATGDSGRTAAAIGREIGLCGSDVRAVEGIEVDSLDDSALVALLKNPSLVFARVTPEHKLRLVELLQSGGEVVAVTGDGVNDAPALKRADIGVAMGATGTDVAREAADMVLADDHFTSIVSAIKEGRAVFDNLRKFVTYIFTSNIPELVPFVAFVLFRIPLPLTVMQVLAVDLGTDLLPALALGAEPPEDDVMRRLPRRRTERLLDRATLLRAYGWLGPLEAACSMLAYFFVYRSAGWQWGEAMADSGPIYRTATTMSLAAIVASQVGNVFACRSSRQAVWHTGWMTNRFLLAAIAAELLLLVALIYTPWLASAFGLAPLQARHWVFLSAIPLFMLSIEEGRKWFVRRAFKSQTIEVA